MTEKSYNPKQKEKKAMKKQETVQTPKKQLIKEVPKKDTKKEDVKMPEEKKTVETSKPEEKKTKDKKTEKPKPEVVKVKKTEAVVNGQSVPISTKYAVEICRFIKNKPIDVAINYLEEVLAYKKAIPMRGEYAHKKGKKMSSGKYPKNATEHFIKLLRSLASNSIANGVDEPIIVEAMANTASRPMGKFGRWQRKRTHIKIVAKKKKSKKKKKENKK